MKKIIKITESQIVDIVKKVLKEQQISQESYERMAMDNANEIELIKNAAGLSFKTREGVVYDKYNNRGMIQCSPCSLTVSGSLEQDIAKNLWCVNKSVLNFKKFDCPEGYNVYSVMGKEYGMYDLNDIPKIANKVSQLHGKYEPYYKGDILYSVGKTVADVVKSGVEFIYENRHGILTTISIVGLIIPVVGPIISLTADLASAGLLFGEGKTYSSGLTLIFGLLPAGQLLKYNIKKTPTFISKVSKLVKLEKAGKLTKNWISKTFSKSEIESLEGLSKNGNRILIDTMSVALKKMINVVFKKAKLNDLIEFYKLMSTKYPKTVNILGQGVTIGGVWYTWYKLAKIWGINDKEDEKMSQKFDNEQGQLKVQEITENKLLSDMNNVDQNKLNLKMMNELNKIIEENKKSSN